MQLSDFVSAQPLGGERSEVARGFNSGQSFSLLAGALPSAGVPECLGDGALLFP